MDGKTILQFFETVEEQVQDTEYGELEIEVVLANGIPNMQSLIITKVRKRKYKND